MLAACSGGGSTSLPATAGADSAGGTLSTRSIAAATQGIGTLNAASPFWKHQCQSDRKRCIMHVLLISIDGMHGVDLQRFVSAHPYSAVGKLARTGVTYENAHAPVPTDSFPGLLALTTGGHPVSTGVYYEVSYDRSLYAPKSNCTGTPGTVVAFDESIDIDSTKIDGGGGINPAALTQQLDHGTCKQVFPHDYLRVNTIFEAVKAAHRGRTAWSDKEQSYEMLNGPSGHGVDDFYNREIAAGGTTSSLPATEAYDDTKVAAIINEIDGKSARGVPGVGVPAIFGMNFQAVSVGQKLLHFDNTTTTGGARGGYQGASGTPTPVLEQAIEYTDTSIGKFVSELRKKGLTDSTLLVISAKHGQAPINYALRRGIAGAGASFGTLLAADGFAATTTDDLALIWLNHPVVNLDDARTKLEALSFKTALGYENGELYTPTNRPSGWGQPSDPRYPDFAVKVDLGVIYTGGTKIAEHGGFSDDDTHVALLVSRAADDDVRDNTAFGGRGHVVEQLVQTAQVAPTILQALSIDPHQLQAVQQEGTQQLPELDL
jgi:Type I phosphodiesterase / nucleotide pyrophosphatase